MIPTAALMGRATEELADRSGPGIGGLLNVTFGNAPELIIALFALHEGLQEVVKASLVGSILGNILLVHGRRDARRRLEARAPELRPHRRERAGADAAAGRRRARRCRRSSSSSRAAACRSPSAEAVNFHGDIEHLSVAVAIVLLITYVAGLFFSLKTHRDLFNPEHDGDDEEGEPWTVRKA